MTPEQTIIDYLQVLQADLAIVRGEQEADDRATALIETIESFFEIVRIQNETIKALKATNEH